MAEGLNASQVPAIKNTFACGPSICTGELTRIEVGAGDGDEAEQDACNRGMRARVLITIYAAGVG